MKALMLILAIAGASANARIDDLKPLGLKPSCEDKMMKAAFDKCNRDSKDDAEREHPCLLNVVEVVRNQSDSAYFTLLFTVTDAVEYNYAVSIEDKTACKFKVINKN